MLPIRKICKAMTLIAFQILHTAAFISPPITLEASKHAGFSRFDASLNGRIKAHVAPR